jgi:hypothetical protein
MVFFVKALLLLLQDIKRGVRAVRSVSPHAHSGSWPWGLVSRPASCRNAWLGEAEAHQENCGVIVGYNPDKDVGLTTRISPG